MQQGATMGECCAVQAKRLAPAPLPPRGQALHKGHVAAGEEEHGQGVQAQRAVAHQRGAAVLRVGIQLPLAALQQSITTSVRKHRVRKKLLMLGHQLCPRQKPEAQACGPGCRQRCFMRATSRLLPLPAAC